jgi:flagellin
LGDSVTIAGRTYEFQTAAGAVTAGNVKATIVAGGTSTDSILALKAAIDAEYTAGRTHVVTSGASATNLTVTSDLKGTGTIAFAEPTSTNAGALTTGVAGGVAAADGTGVTTRGTLTLSASSSFTVGGADVAFGGFAAASVALTKLDTVNISTVTGANAAIAILDGALSQVTSIRADLGAVQNRFGSTVANLSTTAENLSAARSRILDADFAAETANLTRGQILQQAGIAILAQANALPQNVLALLK